MTKAQRTYLMANLWPAACRRQSWDRNDRALRVRVLSQAVGRELASANDLNQKEDFDRVKAHLRLLADNVAGAVETDHPELGDRRRLLWLVEHNLRNQLSELVDDPDAYIAAVIRDKFGVTAGLRTLQDLSAEALIQLVMTLNARIGLRKRAKSA